MNKRLLTSLITGAFLGIICVVGGSIRARGLIGNEIYLAAMWYNRVIIGLVIGLAGSWKIIRGPLNRYVRGALLGLVVSTAFFLSTGMRDIIAFIAGIVYGIITEYVAYRFE